MPHQLQSPQPSSESDGKALRSAPGHAAARLCAGLCVSRRIGAGQRLESQITQIYEGTNQVQRIVMARKLLERY